jgi:hypothetical protein
MLSARTLEPFSLNPGSLKLIAQKLLGWSGNFLDQKKKET